MEWYEDQRKIAAAVQFIRKYSCAYGMVALASDKTPCANYLEGDKEIPEKLQKAVKEYLTRLNKKERRELNREISMWLGERFFTRESSIVRLLCRILDMGDPCEDTSLIEYTLQMQIKKRRELLNTLVS